MQGIKNTRKKLWKIAVWVIMRRSWAGHFSVVSYPNADPACLWMNQSRERRAPCCASTYPTPEMKKELFSFALTLRGIISYYTIYLSTFSSFISLYYIYIVYTFLHIRFTNLPPSDSLHRLRGADRQQVIGSRWDHTLGLEVVDHMECQRHHQEIYPRYEVDQDGAATHDLH